MAGERYAIKVEGLSKTVRALREVDREHGKAVRLALNNVAEIVAEETRAGVTVRTGRARNSVRAASTQRAARVKAGGKRVPYFGFLEFGGSVGPNDSVKRTTKKGGLWMFPSFGRTRHSGKLHDELHDRLADVIRRAGLDVG